MTLSPSSFYSFYILGITIVILPICKHGANMDISVICIWSLYFIRFWWVFLFNEFPSVVIWNTCCRIQRKYNCIVNIFQKISEVFTYIQMYLVLECESLFVMWRNRLELIGKTCMSTYSQVSYKYILYIFYFYIVVKSVIFCS
jgi:hypothetical protein